MSSSSSSESPEPSSKSKEKDIFEDYRKTCSTIFGKASQSQLKYIQAFTDLQQAMLTSCESVVAKQISSLEEYSRDRNSGHLELPLRIYSGTIDAYLTAMSSSYDMGVQRLQFYRSILEYINDITSRAFSFNKVQKK